VPSTDKEGEVRIGPLPAGLPLRVGFSELLNYLALDDTWRGEGGPEITLTAGETRELPALRAGVAQGTLRGTVVGEDGRPVAGAEVRAIIPSAFPIKTLTDAEGSFALTSLLSTSADLWVLASRPVERLHVAQKTGPTTRECRLVLRPLTSARGQLADAQGQPVAGVHVYPSTFLRGAAGEIEDQWGRLLDGLPRPNEVDTDAEGSWEVEGLVSGAPYMLLLSNTVLNLDTGPLAFVADADEPVDIGLLMGRN
jgi:hypothetical protein